MKEGERDQNLLSGSLIHYPIHLRIWGQRQSTRTISWQRLILPVVLITILSLALGCLSPALSIQQFKTVSLPSAHNHYLTTPHLLHCQCPDPCTVFCHWPCCCCFQLGSFHPSCTFQSILIIVILLELSQITLFIYIKLPNSLFIFFVIKAKVLPMS